MHMHNATKDGVCCAMHGHRARAHCTRHTRPWLHTSENLTQRFSVDEMPAAVAITSYIYIYAYAMHAVAIT